MQKQEDEWEEPVERSASCLGRINGVSKRTFKARSNSICTYSNPQLDDDMISVMLVDDVDGPVVLTDQKPVTVGDIKLNNNYCFDQDTIKKYD